MGKKVLVIGLDGFTWKTLDYLKNDLKMENLEKLRENSAWGKLESTLPPNTIPAWISFATGCNPGKHGVFDFLKAKGDLSRITPVSSKDIKADAVQQIIRRNGMKSVIFNLPGSTPALTEDITIGSFLSAGKDWFYPPDLQKIPEIKCTPRMTREGALILQNPNTAVKNLLQMLDWRIRLGKKLFMEKWDFYFLLVTESDPLQHIVFEQIKKGKLKGPLKRSVIELYKKMDEALGWYMDNMDDETYLIVVSDHGFESYEYVFCLKNFLREKNLLEFYRAGEKIPSYLKEKETAKGSRLGLNIAPIINLMYKQKKTRGLLDFATSAYKRIDSITPLSRYVSVLGFRMHVNPAKSIAMPLTVDGYGIYINKKSKYENGILGDEAGKLEEKIITMLKNEKSPFTGKNPFRNVYRAKELYFGPYVGNGPDILIELDDHAIMGDAHFAGTYYKTIKNYHDRYGIFVISGPGVKRGRITDRRLIDIAPTVLYMLGIAVPSHMDGKPINDAFEKPKEVKISDSSKLLELREKIKKLKKESKG